jgi:hypothetical protein
LQRARWQQPRFLPPSGSHATREKYEVYDGPGDIVTSPSTVLIIPDVM